MCEEWLVCRTWVRCGGPNVGAVVSRLSPPPPAHVPPPQSHSHTVTPVMSLMLRQLMSSTSNT